MVKNVFELLFIIFISAILQAPAFSAEITKSKPKPDPSGGLSISPTFGYLFFDRSEQIKAQESYGIKVGYETIEKSMTDSIGVEGTLNYFKTGSKANSSTGNGYTFHLDVTYPFPINKKWMPFIAGGVGGRMVEMDAGKDTKFLLNYGVGVKYFIYNYLALRVDARQLGVIDNAMIRKNYEVGLGLSYYFGKERPKQLKAQPAPEKKKVFVLEDEPLKNDVTANTGSITGSTATVSTPPNSETPAVASGNNRVIKSLQIEFDKGSSSVKPSNFSVFKEIASSLSSSSGVVAQIVRHPDTGATSNGKNILIDQRANSIRGNLLNLKVNPQQIIITTFRPSEPVNGSTLGDAEHKNNLVDIVLVQMDEESLKLLNEQEHKREADQIAKARLDAENLAKSRIKALVSLQETNGVLPVDTDSNLFFEVSNRGLNTEEYLLSLIMPKEFDGVLTRANRPDEKVTNLILASGETFKGSVLFRIPAGMADGQRTTISVKAVSNKFRDVIFNKDAVIVSSAPMVQVAAVLDKHEAAPGENLNYHLTVHNAGSLSARSIVIKVELPKQVDFTDAFATQFTRDANGLFVFTISEIESGKFSEINIVSKIRENSKIGQELVWHTEVIEGSVQKRSKSTVSATVAPSK